MGTLRSLLMRYVLWKKELSVENPDGIQIEFVEIHS
jgi:hypothetical protein